MDHLGIFIVAGLGTGAVYVLSGIGLVVLYRATGVLNFSQGAVGAVGAFVAWQLSAGDWSAWVAWSIGVLSSVALSILYGALIAPRLTHADAVVKAAATLGFSMVLLGLVQYIWGDTLRILRLPTDTMGLSVLDVRVTYSRLLALGIALAVAMGISLALMRTRVGLSMRALANDRAVAAQLGVSVTRVELLSWAISGAIAGVSGLLLANLVRLNGMALTFMVIPALAAAVAGRLHSLAATVFAGLAIGVLEAVATPFESVSALRSGTPFIFAVVVLILLQRGRREWFGASVGQTVEAPLSRSHGSMLSRSIVPAAVLLAALTLPDIMPAYWLKTFTSVAALCLAALSVALLHSQLGIVSLAQYALLGLGGWFALRIAHGLSAPFEVCALAGGVAAAVFGLLAGLPALRMRGLYLALVTLMMAGAVQVILNAVGFPDGGEGLFGRADGAARAWMPRPALAQGDEAYFRYVVAVATLGFLLVWWQKRSRAGRAWAQIRRSEVCAMSAGVNVVAYKMWAFALAGFLAGLAGAMTAGALGQLEGRTFLASDSIMLFALTVVGGSFHWTGIVIAALLLRAAPALLYDLGVNGHLLTSFFGAALLHALITAPQGIAGQLLEIVRSWKARWWPAQITPPRAARNIG